MKISVHTYALLSMSLYVFVCVCEYVSAKQIRALTVHRNKNSANWRQTERELLKKCSIKDHQNVINKRN